MLPDLLTATERLHADARPAGGFLRFRDDVLSRGGALVRGEAVLRERSGESAAPPRPHAAGPIPAAIR
ncbi:hypothetical protein E6C76_03120 [Pseudothauera nasutitermitis]|uniref:Uncharacterized protein n=1 Tax=Pseudothauera nasutitermitis TaxID=2565930 RepID=A0A4S4B3W3_9RHOO|nr:hypothetical protein [Pseudothauera nasutitermitis]THF67377.1 hypothetical protein E6C76_03120 [Pseudothauera nasutitermitis]